MAAIATLRPLCAGVMRAISLAAGVTVVGRGSGGLLDPRVSRQHARFTASAAADGTVSLRVESIGRNALQVERAGEPLRTLRAADGALAVAIGDEAGRGEKRWREAEAEEEVMREKEVEKEEEEMLAEEVMREKEVEKEEEMMAEEVMREKEVEKEVEEMLGKDAKHEQEVMAEKKEKETEVMAEGEAGKEAPLKRPNDVEAAAAEAMEWSAAISDAGVMSAAACEWEARTLPPFRPPPKPSEFGGLGALERLAAAADERAAGVLLRTDEFVVAYDVYPKAAAHVLLLPRERLAGPAELRRHHLPMLRRMRSLAAWVDDQLHLQLPELAPMRAGFHAVPSMRHLHLHLISLDFDSAALKTKKHFNSFTTDFFVPPAVWEAELAAHGKLNIREQEEELKLKQPMRCPFTGKPLKNIPELKAYLASQSYKQLLSSLSSSHRPKS
ncbi:hypothetical protein AB1Y20_010723 [Prymnesium parvum]|uniref:HIT domain-containing protein n=1 Tax=Prymnesium parvum TaxID=97485 RepID=A0AB34IS68_PRYPA